MVLLWVLESLRLETESRIESLTSEFKTKTKTKQSRSRDRSRDLQHWWCSHIQYLCVLKLSHSGWSALDTFSKPCTFSISAFWLARHYAACRAGKNVYFLGKLANFHTICCVHVQKDQISLQTSTFPGKELPKFLMFFPTMAACLKTCRAPQNPEFPWTEPDRTGPKLVGEHF